MIDKVNVPMIDELGFPGAHDCTEDGWHTPDGSRNEVTDLVGEQQSTAMVLNLLSAVTL